MTKTISLADDAYELLAKAKRPGESFSDVAARLARREIQARLFDRTLRADMTDAEAEAMKRRIRKERDDTARPRVTFE